MEKLVKPKVLIKKHNEVADNVANKCDFKQLN